MSEYSVACKIHRRLPVHVRLCSIRLAPCMLPEATCNNTELSNQVVGQFFQNKYTILGVGKIMGITCGGHSAVNHAKATSLVDRGANGKGCKEKRQH